MTAYWLVFLLPLFGALAPPRTDQTMRWMAYAVLFSALAIFIGFRWGVGCDWDQYDRYYQWGIHDTLGESIGRTDLSYGFLNWLYAKLGWGVQAVNFTCALIFTAGLITFARRQVVPWLALVVAMPYMVFVVAMGYTRQATALGIVLFAFLAFSDRRLVRYLVLIGIAATFHKSALALAPLAIFLRREATPGLIALMAIGFLGLFVATDTLDTYLYRYVERQYEGEGIWYRLPINIGAALAFLAFRKRWRAKYGGGEDLYMLLSLVAFALIPLALFSSVIADRLSVYLLPLQVAVLSRVPPLIKRPEFAFTGALAITGAYAFMLYFWFNYANHAACWLPYKSWLLI